MDFIYDNNGKPYAFYYDGTLYYYITNLQGDVIRIIDTAGATICTYTYDAWGRLLNSSTNQIFKANPIRYRGYYYDTESGLYYLGSRYYDPQVKRFINADGAALATINPYSDGLTDKNYFAYCDNSPVSRSDDGGQFWIEAGIMVAGGLIDAATSAIGSIASQKLDGEGVNWKSVAVSAASGFVSGAVSASPLGQVGQMVVGGIISGVSYAADCYVTKKAPNIVDAAFEIGSGVLSGRSGKSGVNKGAELSDLYYRTKQKIARERRRENQSYAAKAIRSAVSYRNNVFACAAWYRAAKSVVGTGKRIVTDISKKRFFRFLQSA